MTTDINTQLGSDRMSVDSVTVEDVTIHADNLVDRMNTFGIDTAVITPVNPYYGNEVSMKAAEIYPDRLYSACTLFPRPIEDARETLRTLIDRGCLALVLDDSLFHPSDPAAQALVHTAVQEEIAVYFRCREVGGEVLSFIDNASLLYPSARFVILSMGGLFSFPNVIPLLKRDNVWLEISQTIIRLLESPLRVYLDALIQDMGTSKLVYGSTHHTDYPELAESLNLLGLNFEQMKTITKENAWVILGLDFC
jgi:predicted TIM-barrel fold metal-dependent hydrolase